MPLASYQAVASEYLLNQVVLERMLAGPATRRHPAAAEPVGAAVQSSATSMSKSAISRRFVAPTQKQVEQLLARDLSDWTWQC